MEIFERVEFVLKSKGHSRHSLAKRLGVAQVTFNRYFNKENQDKLSAYLWLLLDVYPDVRRDWLFFDEGQPFSEAPSVPTPDVAVSVPSSIPITGFASCGIDGWNGCMTYPLAVPVPHMRPDMLAIMATGESMLPEGIGHGHICFCDPHADPIPGECVYVTHKDKMATLKAYVGPVEMGAGMGYRLKGWHDKVDGEPQKHFYLDVLQQLVVTLAPVVYVQRRL